MVRHLVEPTEKSEELLLNASRHTGSTIRLSSRCGPSTFVHMTSSQRCRLETRLKQAEEVMGEPILIEDAEVSEHTAAQPRRGTI